MPCYLALAERHVIEGTVRIERQARLVKRLCPGTRAAIIAYQSLVICSETLNLMKWHLEIERQLARRRSDVDQHGAIDHC